mmetsp:Transcript_15966/g.46211  ORF Transcript_15966/g.46211 Transcript_15966/m.46211 type:complete len:105 (-) Transcript_15966:287-601(-)
MRDGQGHVTEVLLHTEGSIQHAKYLMNKASHNLELRTGERLESLMTNKYSAESEPGDCSRRPDWKIDAIEIRTFLGFNLFSKLQDCRSLPQNRRRAVSSQHHWN